MTKLDLKQFEWIRQPKSFKVIEDNLEVQTQPHTDLWQRTYYHFRIDSSADGVIFDQMRICHMHGSSNKVSIGVYACSFEASSFKAIFSQFQLTDCQWQAHDGQLRD